MRRHWPLLYLLPGLLVVTLPLGGAKGCSESEKCRAARDAEAAVCPSAPDSVSCLAARQAVAEMCAPAPKPTPKPVPTPPPECLPGVPWCVEGQSCGQCKHNPTPDPTHCEMAPRCPNPKPTPCPDGSLPHIAPCITPPCPYVCPPPPSGCEVNEATLIVVKGVGPLMTKAVTDAMKPLGDTTGQPPAQTLEALAAGLRTAGECAVAGQEAVFVKRPDKLWDEFHAVYFGTGALIPGGKWVVAHREPAGPVTPPPPPPVASCPKAPCPARVWTAETLPDGWDRALIGTAAWQFNGHESGRVWEDFTPVVTRDEPYCAKIGMSPSADGKLRAQCPVRPDGHPDRELIETWLIGGAPVPDSRNGQDCNPEGRPAFAVPRGSNNCRLCDAAKLTCSGWI